MSLYLDELEACHGAPVRVASEAMLDAARSPYPKRRRFAFRSTIASCATRRPSSSIRRWSQTRLSAIAPAVRWRTSIHHVLPGEDQSQPSSGLTKRRSVGGDRLFRHITSEKCIEADLRVLAHCAEL